MVSEDRKIDVSHGSIGWSCHGEFTVKDVPKENRMLSVIEGRGSYNGKMGVFGLCPLCLKENREKWMLLGIEENQPGGSNE